MNSVQNLSRQTRGRVGSKNAQTRCQIRQLFPSRLKTLPGVPLGVCANDCRPAALRKVCGVISQGFDRAGSGLNSMSTAGQTWPLDSQTGRLKKWNGSFYHCFTTVSHAGDTARGFPRLGRVPRDLKMQTARPKETRVQAAVTCNGFTVCTG